MAMIKRLYGRHYNIEQLFVSPADQGHAGIARERTYLILTLKCSVVKVHDVQAVYKKVSKYIQQRVQTRPHDYLISTPTDLQREATYVANLRKKKFIAHKIATLPGNVDWDAAVVIHSDSIRFMTMIF